MQLFKFSVSVKTLSNIKSNNHLGKAMMILKKKRKSRKMNSSKRKMWRLNLKKLSQKILTMISCSEQSLNKNMKIQIQIHKHRNLPRMKKVPKIYQKSHT